MTLSFDNFNALEAHEKFKQLNISKFSLDEIDRILKTKYKAKEMDSDLFSELHQDPFFNPSFLTKCYLIDDQSVLENLYNKEEKITHNEFKESYGTLTTKIDHSNPEERNHAASQGTLLYIIFQSEDGKYLSPFISTYGPCEKIMFEFMVFKGIDPSKCVLGDMDYKLYLFSLVSAGYIKI
ncbi:hypothetical protein CU633_03975 [Bacillus sp. V3-13]|uniref:hypothetical protein n=1 Tax=Bacillus sp. V3-13 TaxID=2053728 RepID=UPI000C7690A3|nr:hypothetical protein [Bacillus sp. V3-13]PLR78719.1 hypothetical protein CU633_03975 [Bacillus sp. V3-13]